jgi:hypothetical protein
MKKWYSRNQSIKLTGFLTRTFSKIKENFMQWANLFLIRLYLVEASRRFPLYFVINYKQLYKLHATKPI